MDIFELTDDCPKEWLTESADLFIQQVSLTNDPAAFQKAFNALELAIRDSEHTRVVIARDSGHVLGLAFMNIKISMKSGGRYLWLNELYVHDDYRNMGIGKKLLLYIIHFAEQHDIKTIELETGVNNSVTKHIYNSLGFYEVVSKRYGFSF